MGQCNESVEAAVFLVLGIVYDLGGDFMREGCDGLKFLASFSSKPSILPDVCP